MLGEKIYIFQTSNQIYLLHLQLQTFILFTYGEMWLLNKISCEIQILNEKVGKLMIENGKLEEENKKLKSDLEECECSMHFENDEVGYRKRECKKLKEELSKYEKQHQHSMGFSDFGGYYLDNNK